PRGEFLGEFEQMVLLAVARLGEEAYGMAILDEIEEKAGIEPSVASVYAALDRLEGRGYVTSRMGEPTAERGGRAKRFFRLEPAGAEELERARSALDALWEGLRLDPDGVP
ncbi:MAG: PadR family transcriptional regulator, partial [Gemmatimonadetes bacterium]|nr:PadR family transcriptional regulator [Gemmatimonadota bacterium]NIR81577.1 PadR family transcriptional regulator [Gemmatimonadota bacterium]NIT90418.1 PadR family transcriptional regulator [Gemmatimonadota bacterium]NIU34252.1 PadR family transcriptional regulator [Gemmatimonadota bacterium]NIU38380.1 PadR family transcriptional regulator [Gemmatimonadota bacterium]